MQDICINEPLKVEEVNAAELPVATIALRLLCHLAPLAGQHEDQQRELARRAFDLADAFLAEAERRAADEEETLLARYTVTSRK